MFPAQEEADRTVFVGNLEARVREEILYELFLQAGPLTKVTICKDREGKPKSFGFVCFKHPESVSYAIALLNGIRLYGRPINVQYRFGSSRSSEPANQSFESCVKINSHSYSIPKFTANGMLFKKRPADGARVTCVVELPLLQASGGFDLHPLAPAFPLGKEVVKRSGQKHFVHKEVMT
uniref:splicing regulator RBM11 n=1 Tax=Panthera onca TaxID=9690 RepID=UPI002953620B|nr:splicing regulator RBM11 [Panthera onca]